MQTLGLRCTSVHVAFAVQLLAIHELIKHAQGAFGSRTLKPKVKTAIHHGSQL